MQSVSRGLPFYRRFQKNLLLFSLLAPATLIFCGIILYPLLYGISLSFSDTDPTTLASKFVGLDNYGRMLKDSTFWISLRVTFIYATATVIVELPLAFAIALLLNEDIGGRWLYRGLLLLPWVMPNIAAAVIWGWMYSADYGLVNYYLTQLGLLPEYIGWLSNITFALPATIIVQIWKGLPWTTVVLLAGLQTISAELLEAAEVDGANAWQRLWHVKFRLLLPIILIAIVLRFAWTFNTFDLVYVLTSGGPGYATYLLSIYMYLTSFSFREMGYGSTLATTMLFILLVLSTIFIRLVSNRDV